MKYISEEQPFSIEYKLDKEPFKLKPHYHNTHEIVFILKGKSQIEISDKNYEAKANSMVFINNLESHNNFVTEFPYERYFMLISQEYFRSFISDPILMSIVNYRPETFNHLLNLCEIDSIIINNIIENIYKEFINNKPYSYDCIANYLNLLFIHLFRTNPEWFPANKYNYSLEIINSIQNYIEKEYLNNISLKETAELFNIDMYYLSHLFRDVTGFSFKEYLISQRLSKAKEFLVLTNKNITDVCFDSGFNNISHFIRIFKKKEGITPLQFKKSYQKNKMQSQNRLL